MAEPDRPFAGGLSQQDPPRRVSGAELIAAILSVLWFAICILLWFMPGFDWSGPALLTWLMGLLVPIALIWIAVATVRHARELKAEASDLRHALAELRRAQAGQDGNTGDAGDLARKLNDIAAAQAQMQAHLTALAAPPQAAAPQPVPPAPEPAGENRDPEPQPSLSLDPPADTPREPVTLQEFIRALNFPENEHDVEGFDTLRKALQDPWTQRLVRFSQDVLTLLSQDGIYMDDLRPDRARPEVWRAFARGERGRAIAGLGGVHDRSSLALASGRMRQDPVFRDASHHFLRAFDQTFLAFEQHATDQDIIDLANTRTARAFMLLGRVTGTFD